MNLYEIDEQILNCISKITDADTGEVIGEQADFDMLNELQIERDTKIEQIALWVKELNAEAVAIKTEKDRLSARETSKKNKAESLKKYLMSVLDGSKFETAKCSVSFRKSDVLQIDEGATIPEEYFKHKAPEIDKAGLKKAIKNGLELDGVSIVDKQNIQIK